MTTTITATLTAADADSAIATATKHVAKVAGFTVTGNTAVRSARHHLHTVEIADHGGDRDDLWIVLTSYGISPQPGVSSFGDSMEAA